MDFVSVRLLAGFFVLERLIFGNYMIVLCSVAIVHNSDVKVDALRPIDYNSCSHFQDHPTNILKSF